MQRVIWLPDYTARCTASACGRRYQCAAHEVAHQLGRPTCDHSLAVGWSSDDCSHFIRIGDAVKPADPPRVRPAIGA